MRVHRAKFSFDADSETRTMILHMKCPSCYYFTEVEREADGNNVALVGYPDITGEVDDSDPFGWTDEEAVK